MVPGGDIFFGGDSSLLQDQLQDVQQIQASSVAFAAILGDGSVATWGDAHSGGDNFLVLVDPLPEVCHKLKSHLHDNKHVAVLCCAVSSYTGTAQFLRYNVGGISSSLTPTTKGTSHDKLAVVEKITVKVMKAADILDAYFAKGNRVYKLKTDMQGSDMTALQNLRPIFSKPIQIR